METEIGNYSNGNYISAFNKDQLHVYDFCKKSRSFNYERKM